MYLVVAIYGGVLGACLGFTDEAAAEAKYEELLAQPGLDRNDDDIHLLEISTTGEDEIYLRTSHQDLNNNN